MRIEKDTIGEVEIPADALYGIHALRSNKNFPSTDERVNPYLIHAYLQVKLAAAKTNRSCDLLSKEKFNVIEKAIENLLEESSSAISGSSNSIYNKIIVDPLQGGAGTSLNMNVNEVIANSALLLMGNKPGDYDIIHPLDEINLSQSTNDTYPTAMKIAGITLLRELADSFAELQRTLQSKEEEFKNIIKLGRTQFQDAVPITLGQEFGAFAQAIARDRWRLYNAEERLRSVNMGGTAIGNSIAASRNFILKINAELKKVTGLPIAKGEDLIDTTQNLDVIAEVHGIVKAGAVSVIKISNDLRFLSSGPYGGIGEIKLPPMQAGSSIMPGKVNPVIPENAIQIGEIVKGNDVVISNMTAAGHLELNAFSPIIAHLFLKSLYLLKEANLNLSKNCIAGIEADKVRCHKNLISSSAVSAALITRFGYDKIQEIVKIAYEERTPFVEKLINSGLINEDGLYKILSEELGIEIE